VSLVYPAELPRWPLYSVCSGLSARQLRQREARWRLPRRSGQQQQREKDSSSSSPGPWPGTARPPVVAPAPHPRGGQQASPGQPHPGSIPPRQLPGLPPFASGRPAVIPRLDAALTTLPLPRLKTVALPQTNSRPPGTRDTPQSHPVVAGSHNSAGRHWPSRIFLTR